MRHLNVNVVIALLLLLGSGALYADTYFYNLVPGAIIGSKIWPRLVTVFLGGLSVIYLVQSLRAPAAAPATDKAAWNFTAWLKFNRNVIGCFALYGAFLFLLQWLGMLLGGMLFVFSTLCFLGPNTARSHLVNAAVSIVAIGCMWAVFKFGLGVILPEGEILPR